MPTYIALLNWTAQGRHDIKQSPSRVDASKKHFESIGAKLKDFYMVMGRYDCVVVIEAPDDEALAKVLLLLGSQGSVVSETCRAFGEDEFRDIISKLG